MPDKRSPFSGCRQYGTGGWTGDDIRNSSIFCWSAKPGFLVLMAQAQDGSFSMSVEIKSFENILITLNHKPIKLQKVKTKNNQKVVKVSNANKHISMQETV